MSEQMNTLWQQIPAGVDPAPLQSLANDTSLEILHALLTEFRSELTSQRHMVEKAALSSDRASLGNSFHTTKGLAATFGLKELKAMSEKLELQAKESSDNQLKDLVNIFKTQLDEASQIVGTLINLVEGHL